MKRNIYQSDINTIRELKQLRNKDKLVSYVASRSKQLNQRFYRLEKADKSNFKNESAYYYARQETDKEKPRYSTSINKLSKLSDEDLYELALSLNEKLSSKTSTIGGLEEIAERRLTKGVCALEKKLNTEINQEQFNDFIRADGYELLNDFKHYDSKQVIEDWLSWLEKGVTTRQFIKNYSRFKRKGKHDKGKVNRYFKELVASKKHPKNLRKKK